MAIKNNGITVKKKGTTPFVAVLMTVLLLSCSDSDPQPGCFQELGLNIEEALMDVSGIIRGPGNVFCSDAFVIEPDVRNNDRPLGSLFPCNLETMFQEDGADVIFSGYVYQGINDGDQCADFFEITAIRLR